jgi:hypothetical protein
VWPKAALDCVQLDRYALSASQISTLLVLTACLRNADREHHSAPIHVCGIDGFFFNKTHEHIQVGTVAREEQLGGIRGAIRELHCSCGALLPERISARASNQSVRRSEIFRSEKKCAVEDEHIVGPRTINVVLARRWAFVMPWNQQIFSSLDAIGRQNRSRR